jgi:F-box protein 9
VPVPRAAGDTAGVGLDGQELPPPPLALIQRVLTRDALLEVFLRLAPRDAARCAAVCRQARAHALSSVTALGRSDKAALRSQWRVVSEAQPIWRAACLAVPQWRRAEEGEEESGDRRVSGAARVERHADRYFDSDWRLMYRVRPRLRTDGIYVSR